MNIFADLESAVAKTQQKLKAASAGTPEHEEECLKLAALNAVTEYIRSGKWSKKKGGHERVMLVLRSKNYAEAAQQLNTSEESLRASVYQASERIRSIIGFDVLSEIMSDNVIDAIDKFRLRTSDAALQIFPAEAMAQFPKECGVSKTDGESFLSAVEVLRSVTIRAIEDAFDSIDNQILGTINYLLFANDIKYIRQTAALYEYLTGYSDLETLRKKLNIKRGC